MDQNFLSGPFAMLPDALQAVAARLADFSAGTAGPAGGAPSGLVRSGRAAVIDVTGMIAPSDSAFLRFVGGTSLDRIRAGLNASLADSSVDRIVMHIDSPGGQVTGVSELADEIFAARDRKPIVAYVGGTGASAAYWLASAASQIVTSDTGLLGSIGVASVVMDARVMLDRVGIRRHEVVSSQSPRKRPDLATDAGRAQIQQNVDDLAAVFVGKVARHRGVTAKDVVGRFGQGGVMVGHTAVAAGLADAVGRFSDVLQGAGAGKSARQSVPASAAVAGHSPNLEVQTSARAVHADSDHVAARAAWYALPPSVRMCTYHNNFAEYQARMNKA